MNECRTVSVSIASDPAVVYNYASNPAHIPEWSAFIRSIRAQGDGWIAHTPKGEVYIEFTKTNAFRILDHNVTVSPELTVHVPMRVLENGSGSEVLFTVFRLPGMSAQDFEADVEAVQIDLGSLKRLLEV